MPQFDPRAKYHGAKIAWMLPHFQQELFVLGLHVLLHTTLFRGGQLKVTNMALEQDVKSRPLPLLPSVKIPWHVDLLDVIEQVLFDVCLKVAFVTFEDCLDVHILYVLLQQLAPCSPRFGEVFRAVRTC